MYFYGRNLSNVCPYVGHCSDVYDVYYGHNRVISQQLPAPAIHYTLLFQTSRRGVSNRAEFGPEQGSKQPIPPSLN